jgi:hypothetical protein
MGAGGQHHAPATLPPGKTRYPLCRTLGGPQGRSGRVRKISPPSGFDPRTVQLTASRYTGPRLILEHIKMGFRIYMSMWTGVMWHRGCVFWRSVLNTVMNFRVPWDVRISYLTILVGKFRACVAMRAEYKAVKVSLSCSYHWPSRLLPYRFTCYTITKSETLSLDVTY